MTKKFAVSRLIAGVALSLVLIAGGAFAQRRGRDSSSSFQRFSLSMGGGCGFLDRGHGMVDLKAEVQVGITRQLRLGLGVGYMSRGLGHEREMDRGGRQGGMMDGRGGGMMDGWMGGTWSSDVIPGYGRQVEAGNDFRVLPLSLNFYYLLPLGRRWDAFMSAGGSYYFGSFGGPDGRQDKNAWGGQAGLGFEFKVTSRINLVAEGGYRFAEFKHLRGPRSQSPMPWLGSLFNDLRPSTDLNRPGMDQLFDSVRRMLQPLIAPQPPRSFDFNFNGFSCRAGVKFGI